MDYNDLYDFMLSVSDELSLNSALSEMGGSIEDYTWKLVQKGTIAYEKTEGILISCIIGYIHDSPDSGSYITQVATRTAFRNQGIAQRLMREYLEYAQKMGIKYVWLTTGIHNVNAQHFYEKCGFENKGKIVNRLTGKSQIRYEFWF